MFDDIEFEGGLARSGGVVALGVGRDLKEQDSLSRSYGILMCNLRWDLEAI